MFTAERRAGAFAAATGLAGLLPVRVGTVQQFRDLLVRMTPDTTHVGFDATPPGPGRERGTAPVVPVAEVLATLRGLGDEDSAGA